LPGRAAVWIGIGQSALSFATRFASQNNVGAAWGAFGFFALDIGRMSVEMMSVRETIAQACAVYSPRAFEAAPWLLDKTREQLAD
jgi:hypothetical protein